MRARSRTWLLAFALLGLLASASSTYIHARILGDPTYTSICDINQTFSCESAYTSRYGTIQGVPVALAGLIFFALTTILLAAAGRASTPGAERQAFTVSENVAAYVYALSTLGLGVVVYFAYASFVVLNTVCVFCILTYVAMVGLFVVSGGASDATARSLPGRVWSDVRRLVARPVALLMALMFVAGASAAVVLFPREPVRAEAGEVAAAAQVTADQQAVFDEWFDSQPRADLPIVADGAAVLVVKFNDFQCPACAEAYFRHKSVLDRYAEEYPGQVKFVAIDFPLNPECNANVSTMVHPAACAGAVAVRLARRDGPEGAEEALVEWLYSNQRDIGSADVEEAVRTVAGLTGFGEQYPVLLPLVKQDADLGGRLAIQGTPTFFINGVRIEGSPRAEYLDAAIAHELRRAGVVEQR